MNRIGPFPLSHHIDSSDPSVVVLVRIEIINDGNKLGLVRCFHGRLKPPYDRETRDMTLEGAIVHLQEWKGR